MTKLKNWASKSKELKKKKENEDTLGKTKYILKIANEKQNFMWCKYINAVNSYVLNF